MNIWKELEIKKTNDKEEITKAYRQKLSTTNPEDSQGAFMRLRKAYEEAIYEAEQADEQEASKQKGKKQGAGTPLDLWIKQAESLYQDFARRIDPKEWKKLLQDPVARSIDTKEKARDQLLDFFLEHVYLSQNVLVVLDHHFHFRENAEALYEEYPKAFVKHIILDSIETQEYPPYDFFEIEEDADYDEYLMLSAQLSGSMMRGDSEEAEKTLAEMERTGVKTPYLILEKVKMCLRREETEQAAQLLSELSPAHKEIKEAQLLQADIDLINKKIKKAKECFEAILKEEPELLWAKYGLGKCLAEEGEYLKAKDILTEVLEADPEYQAASEQMDEINQILIKQWEEDKATGETREPKAMIELAFAYFQLEQFQEAKAVLDQIEPAGEVKIDYVNLAGRLHLFLEQNEPALEYLKEWERLLRTISQDADGELLKKRKRLPFAVFLQGLAYMNLGEMDRALERMEEALNIDPQEMDAYLGKGQVLCQIRDFEGAADVFSEALRVNPEYAGAYILRAEALYQTQRYGEAFEDCESAIELAPLELGAHFWKARTLTAAGEFEMAEEVLEFLQEEGLSGTSLDFVRGLILEEKGKMGEAKVVYENILKQPLEADEEDPYVFHLDQVGEVYYHLALMEFNKNADDISSMVEYIEKGLEQEEYVPLLQMKAYVCQVIGDLDDALELFLKILQIAPGEKGIYGDIDDIYRDLGQWEKALEYANLQLEREASAFHYMRRGQILTYFGRFEEAWDDFTKSVSMDAGRPYPYNYMGVVLEYQGKEKEAIKYYQKSIDLSKEEEEFCEEAYRNLAQLYCKKKEYKKATACLEECWQIGEDPDDLRKQVKIFRTGGLFPQAWEALERFRKAVKLRKWSYAYQWEKGLIQESEGDLEGAFDTFDMISPGEPHAGDEAGTLLYYRGKYEKALKLYKKAFKDLQTQDDFELEMDALDEAGLCLAAGRVCWKLNDKSGIAFYTEEGLKRIPQDFETKWGYQLPKVLQIQGGLFILRGDFVKARQCLKQAREARVCDFCHYAVCSCVYEELGFMAEVLQDYEKALAYYKKGNETDPLDYRYICKIKELKENKQ